MLGYRVEIKGSEYVLDFGPRTLAIFARKNGQDLDAITGGFTLDLYGIILLTYFAIREGHRRWATEDDTAPPQNFSEDTVSDWFEEDPSCAGRVLELYYKSQGLTPTKEEKEQAEDLGKDPA